MALLIDRDLAGVRDLLLHESDLLETADRERVDIEMKIDLAVSEVRTETEIEVEKILRGGTGSGGTLASIDNVVATPSLFQWIQLKSLALFYYECFGRQMNERFRAKFEHYRRRAEQGKQAFLERGIGVADLALPKPEAPAATASGGILPPGNYYVAASWTNNRSQESDLGTIATVSLATNGGIHVSHPVAPTPATGWHVYIGQTPEILFRQNGTPIALGDSWSQAAQTNESNPFSGRGQTPDRYLQPQRIFQRG